MAAKNAASRRPSGFTLIELLVVIAIIAILAAILFPVFARARETARKASCTSNMKQFGNAFNMYVSDYDQRMPMGGWWDRGGLSAANDWHIAMYPYIKNEQVYWCPSTTDLHTGAKTWNVTATDYLYNNQINQGRQGAAEAAITASADCVALIEGHNDWNGDPNCVTPFSNGAVRSNDRWCQEYTIWGNRSDLVTGGLWTGTTRLWGLPRHNGTANVLFVDGHVKSVNLGEPRNATESLARIRSVLPYVKHISPMQNGGDWYQDP